MATQQSAEHQTQARAKALAGDGTAARSRAGAVGRARRYIATSR